MLRLVHAMIAVALLLGSSRPWAQDRQDWIESTPAEQGMNPALLDQLRHRLASSLPHIRSVLVVRNDRLVFEHYGQGLGRNDLHVLNSVTKSVTSSLVGIALQEKLIADLDQKIGIWLPETLAPDVDPRTRNITLRHLLTMTAGFEWDEQARDSCFSARTASCERFNDKGDLLNFALRRPLASEPGTVFRYDSHSSHLLSIILSRATGMSAAKFAEKQLASALGVTRYQWASDAQGHSRGGSGLQLTARDMAKFGTLYLRGGRWAGRQVIPTDFAEASVRQQSAGGWPWPSWARYGYQWWVLPAQSGPASYAANGFGGQYIYVVPSSDLVVVITSHPGELRDTGAILREYVLPSVQPRQP